MTRERWNGMIIGLLYIVAAVSSVIAVVLYQPILSDQWVMSVANGYEPKILMGVFNDLILVMAVIGTAVMLFPYLRHWNEHIALGYLCFRFMEAVFIAIGLVGILGLLYLSSFYETGELSDVDLQAVGFMLQSFHRWTFMLGPNLMLGLNTVLYSYIFLKTGLVPKPLAIFGIITAVMVFLAGILDMFGIIVPISTVKGFLALPVGLYEMTLAVWLIVQGFHKQSFIDLKEIRKR
ncbi:DUF4386 domain-containing protein [Niallia sp. Krafla_26]|uniref:DUF4386 domain-containing protein n=1 Tax=Niallia sp. Krafla_26 TaxID=3064703 RepID=UPI003D1876A1